MGSNYSHPLRFGLGPVGASPASVTALGARAEDLGYDLFTVEDSPGLDAWSAVSWVAGRTTRIRLLPIVNLALQSPAVLGRATASLDLLSGGRLELGLTSDEASDIADAIDIIRGLWAVDNPGLLRHAGVRVTVNGAERGPAPEHDVPILLRGMGERMLRLAGRAADGLSVRYPTALESGNAVIDAAADDAGRDPREVRRALDVDPFDGSPAEWVERLLPHVTEHGVGTFLLRTDDEVIARQFITDVAPALRDAADQAVPGLSTAAPIRPAAALALRADGIDYDGVPASLTAVEPGDTRYSRVRSTYLRGGSPGIVLRPTTVEQVTDAVAYARRHPGVALGIRSAGHGISGRSTNHGGIVIDVSALNSIEVMDRETRRVRVGPGATWAQVASALEPYGWAISSGDFGGVGVGGLATAGGIGFLGRAHGLTIDHLRAVEVALADGRVLRASDTENTELFWAMRGAGANFGIATAFEFEAAEVPAVGWAQLLFDASDIADFLVRWGETQEAAPRDSTNFLIVGAGQEGYPPIARMYGMVDSDDPDTIIARLQPFAELAPMYQQSVQLLPYSAALVAPQGAANGGRGEPRSRSGLLEHITPEFADAAAHLITSGVSQFFQIRSTGGAASDVPSDATAYAHRDANFSVVAMGSQQLDREWDTLRAHFDGLYLSFETGTQPEQIDDAFPPATLQRLRELKASLDPENLFRDNFSITPGHQENVHEEKRTA